MKIDRIRKEKVIQVCRGDQNTLILTQRGNVFSMGSNDQGRLGLGDYDDRKIPTLIGSKYFNHEKIIEICCGLFHCMALTQKGKVYSWGHDQLEHGNQFHKNIPIEIDFYHFDKEPIKLIRCCSKFSFALTRNNKLYAWGDNCFGQLGLGHKDHTSKPTLIDSKTYNNEKIIKVTCDYDHTFITTQKTNENDSNNLYSCGRIEIISILLGIDKNKNTFQLVENLFPKKNSHKKIKDIKASDCFLMVITEKEGYDKLYTWGCNCCGELGLGDLKDRITPHHVHFSCFENHELEPLKNNIPIRIKHISIGKHFSFVITKEHASKRSKICAWGNNEQYQLHLGHCEKVLKPNVIQMNHFKSEEIIWINMNCILYQHSFTISKSGKLFIWGNNYHGQLGLNHCNDVYEPQLCCPELFGVEKTNEKIYNNESFKDSMFEF